MKMTNIFAVGVGLGIASGVFLGMGMAQKEFMDEIDYYKKKHDDVLNTLNGLHQYVSGLSDGVEIATRNRRVASVEAIDCNDCPVADFCEDAVRSTEK